MNHLINPFHSRRQMLASGAALLGVAAIPSLIRNALAADAKPAAGKAPPIRIPDDHKISGFAMGCQAWTFNRFTVLEAIEKTAKAGGRVIEFYPNQAFFKDKDDKKPVWGRSAPQDFVDQVKAKLKEHDILPVNYGVVD